MRKNFIFALLILDWMLGSANAQQHGSSIFNCINDNSIVQTRVDPIKYIKIILTNEMVTEIKIFSGPSRFSISHVSQSGKTYNRYEQYEVINSWFNGSDFQWYGTARNALKINMTGRLSGIYSNAPKYVERIGSWIDNKPPDSIVVSADCTPIAPLPTPTQIEARGAVPEPIPPALPSPETRAPTIAPPELPPVATLDDAQLDAVKKPIPNSGMWSITIIVKTDNLTINSILVNRENCRLSWFDSKTRFPLYLRFGEVVAFMVGPNYKCDPIEVVVNTDVGSRTFHWDAFTEAGISAQKRWSGTNVVMITGKSDTITIENITGNRGGCNINPLSFEPLPRQLNLDKCEHL
jgi:hypothetical protein